MSILFRIISIPFKIIIFFPRLIVRIHRSRAFKRRYQDIDDVIGSFSEKPTDFEQYVAELYRQKGYDTEVTPRTNDGGKDIIIWNDEFSYVVEVKLYAQENRVSREKIQKLHSAMIDSECDGAVFVTTSSFTAPAEEYAEKHGIELINGQELLDFINE